jgi:hypothetical protein
MQAQKRLVFLMLILADQNYLTRKQELYLVGMVVLVSMLIQHTHTSQSDCRWRLVLLTILHTRLVTTLNYSAITDLHTLQITTEPAKSSKSAVFASHSLVTASNSGDSSAFALMP